MILTHCKDCGNELPLKPKFASNWCICNSCRDRKRKELHGGRISTERMWKSVGILDKLTGTFATEETFQRLLEMQDGHCGICEETENLVLDHDHITMYARGVLCHRHNRGLGQLGDSETGLGKALNYLQRVGVLSQIAIIANWKKRI